MLLLALITSFSAFSLPKLNSLPTATATIYLDFDGHIVNSGVWNGGNVLNCASAGMTDAQISEVFNRVAEDYRPFDVNITTDSTVFMAAPFDKRIRVIITPTSSWYPGVGGVAYVGSFNWGDDTPCFVFSDRLGPNSPKIVGECCSHESGHTLGLTHQSKFDASCNLTAIYNDGVGSGETGWAPIMGNSYNRNMTGWSDGPTPYGCSYKQDNLSIITSQNGFGYRNDDYIDILSESAQSINLFVSDIDGIISTSTDKDVFKFSLNRNTSFKLEAKPFTVSTTTNNSGANLDMRAQLYSKSGSLLRVYDPSTTMSVTVDTLLSAGDYYLVLDGAGNSNVGDYGSLGSYKLRGASSSVLPIRSVVLSGKINNDKHDFNWDVVSDEPIKSITMEMSTDGINFKSLNNLSTNLKYYSYVPFENGTVYYRMKVSSVVGESVYSNVITLKSVSQPTKKFRVSTLVNEDISVNATAAYQYQVLDVNGRQVAKGNGLQGYSRISLNGQSKGMYILQLFSNNEKQIERIIKQ